MGVVWNGIACCLERLVHRNRIKSYINFYQSINLTLIVIMDDPKVMNKLVFDYLAEHSSKKMANDFAKSVGKKNIQEKLDGIPSISHMVSELIKNNTFPGKGKRKSEEMNGHGPTSKKAKPSSESDDSDDSSTD